MIIQNNKLYQEIEKYTENSVEAENCSFYTQIDINYNTVSLSKVAQTPTMMKMANKRPIKKFTHGSKKSLRTLLENTPVEWKEHITLLFRADTCPEDGKALKKKIDNMLNVIRYHVKNFHYVWRIEFQRHGIPHIHLITSHEVAPLVENWWNHRLGRDIDGIPDENLVFALKIDTDEYRNNVANYLLKETQSEVPPQFKNVGRLWASSRGLVPANGKPLFQLVSLSSELYEKANEIVDKYERSEGAEGPEGDTTAIQMYGELLIEAFNEPDILPETKTAINQLIINSRAKGPDSIGYELEKRRLAVLAEWFAANPGIKDQFQLKNKICEGGKVRRIKVMEGAEGEIKKLLAKSNSKELNFNEKGFFEQKYNYKKNELEKKKNNSCGAARAVYERTKKEVLLTL